MKFRFLTADDAAEWSTLRLEALRQDPEAFGSSEEDHSLLTLDEIGRRLDPGTGDSFAIGGFENGRLAGMAGFMRDKGPKRRHKGMVWGVYVTKAQRGKGVGRKMLQMLLERVMLTEGVEQVLISVATTQTAASALYRSLGFRPFGREPLALKVNGRFIDEDHMILVLKKSSAL